MTCGIFVNFSFIFCAFVNIAISSTIQERSQILVVVNFSLFVNCTTNYNKKIIVYHIYVGLSCFDSSRVQKGIRGHRYRPNGVNSLLSVTGVITPSHTRPIYTSWRTRFINWIAVFYNFYLLRMYSLMRALHCPKHPNPWSSALPYALGSVLAKHCLRFTPFLT